MTLNRRNRLILLVVAVAIALAGLYSAGWTLLADRWRTGIAAWAESRAEKGWTVSTGAIDISGFPGTIRLSLPEPLARDSDGNEWAGPPLAILVPPFRPFEPGFDAPGIHRVTVPGRAPVEFTAATLTGRLTVAQGKPVALTVAAGTVAGLGLTLQGLNVDVHRAAVTSGATEPPPLVGLIDIDRLTLPEGLRLPLDHTIKAAHLALRVRGALPAGPLTTTLAAWRDAGGTIEIDSLDINWQPLVAAGDATIALDAALQPELAGTIRLRGGSDAIDRAAAAGMIDPSGAKMAKLLLRFTSKPAADGVQEAKAAITIQKRTLSIGPLPLLQMPEVRW